jgi:hypothetical protein
MNTARWVLAHEMQLDRERWHMRQWARLFGVDMDALTPEGEPNPTGPRFGEAPRVFPLAGILNPEAYNNFINQDRSSTVFEETPIDEYEKQVSALEKAGALSDIDIMGDKAEKIVKDKKDRMYGIVVEEDK